MDTVSDTCHGAGHYLFQSGVHHFYGLPGYIGGMDLCVHFYILAYLCGCYLPESFLVILKIFVEKALYGVFIIIVCGNDRCTVDTDDYRISGLFLLATASRTGIVFLGSHADGLHIFFYAVNALYDRGNDDCAPERMDDRKPTCFTDGKGTCTF